MLISALFFGAGIRQLSIGAGIRQLSRLTGVSFGVIQKLQK